MRRQAGRQACISKRESLSMFCLQVAKWSCSRYTDTVHVDLLSICMYVNLPDTLIRVDLPPPRVNLITVVQEIRHRKNLTDASVKYLSQLSVMPVMF